MKSRAKTCLLCYYLVLFAVCNQREFSFYPFSLGVVSVAISWPVA